MEDILYNPVFNALGTGDKHLGSGTETVKYFDEEVSPFAGFQQGYKKGFEDLYDLLPANRKILYATPRQIAEHGGWKIIADIKGLQFVFHGYPVKPSTTITPVVLDNNHVQEMVALARLTKPGPFNSRTIEFGYYHGIFENGKLAAMTGQRLHIENYTEISAVCTHPDHLGKGYAAALMQHQLAIILSHGQKPCLHVREDNTRAIEIYERLGFKVEREMNFYFMRKG
jgi:ribosomal protein S18 acetylase RimI-like enzyme